MPREPDLYRDKIEVSLDGRQIFYLFFGGAVIVCIVFVLGVVVGRRVEARGHASNVDRLASAARDPLAALDRLETGAPLSFRSALRGGTAPSASVDQRIDDLARAQQALGSAEATTNAHNDTAKPTPEPSKPKPEPSKPKLEAKATSETAKPKLASETAKPSVKLEPATTLAAEMASQRSDTASAALDSKTAAAEPTTKPTVESPKAEPTEAKSAPKAKAGSKFTLQVSSFQERGEAETFVAELKSSGYQPYVVQAEVAGKGTFYRVRLGSYPSYDAAMEAKAAFERKVNRIAYVTKL